MLARKEQFVISVSRHQKLENVRYSFSLGNLSDTNEPIYLTYNLITAKNKLRRTFLLSGNNMTFWNTSSHYTVATRVISQDKQQ